MGNAIEHDLVNLETRIATLQAQLASVAEATDLQELYTIIHRPGWTTPAELRPVSGILDAMAEHARTLNGLKQVLMEGSRAVGLK
jgi:hypothetical protein